MLQGYEILYYDLAHNRTKIKTSKGQLGWLYHSLDPYENRIILDLSDVWQFDGRYWNLVPEQF